jgi:SAM-dependent methyltransferase
MKEHTYPIMFRVEQSHWWYTGRRKILARFIEDICRRVTDRRPRILDVGCGTGANLLMLSQYGDAEGVDVSEDALAFCRERGLANVKLGAGEKLP